MAEINLSIPSVSEGTQKFLGRIFGPLAEVGDILSDKIRFYRWKSSLDMIKKAEEIAKINGVEVKEIPLKTLIPLLEKSSLEEEGSDLIDIWANLLAGAAKDFRNIENSYIEILSNLSQEDVSELNRFIPEEYIEIMNKFYQNYSDDEDFSWGSTVYIKMSSDRQDMISKVIVAVEDILSSKGDNFERYELSKSILFRIVYETVGVLEYLFIILKSPLLDDGEGFQHIFAANTTVMKNIRCYDNLISCGLIQKISGSISINDSRTEYEFLMPTILGLNFLHACRGGGLK